VKTLKRKAKRMGKNLGCEGPLHHRVTVREICSFHITELFLLNGGN